MIQDNIINELNYIPESRLHELYQIVHSFRLGIIKTAFDESMNNDEEKIDVTLCLSTLEKIKQGNLAGFSEIEDIDRHTKNLKNEINTG